jgi:HAD superfamily hydrolase (TIGR01509 family)
MRRKSRRFEAVLFDLGGTLIDVRDFSAWAGVAARVGVTVEPEALAQAYRTWMEKDPVNDGITEASWWAGVLTEAASRPVPPPEAERFLSAATAVWVEPRLFSDVRWCLDTFRRQRRRLGVISNSTSQAAIQDLMRRVGILDYFSVVVSSGTEGVRKPDPEIFRRSVERIAVPPTGAFYVGDLPNTDARAAQAAGLGSVWLHRDGTGFGDDPPEITSLTELPGYVERAEAARLS